MVMTVECPECGTAFPVDPGKVPASGVRAQCSVCPGIFPVFPFESDADAWKGEGMAPVEAEPEPAIEGEFEAEPEIAVEPEPAPEPEATWEAATVEEPVAEPEPALEPEATWEAAMVEEPVAEPEPAPAVEAEWESITVEEPAAVPEAEPMVEAEAEAPAPIQFGKRDPHDKAKRLARVLVSDMIVYHREKHTRALESGTLAVEFEEEVEKSWEEYVDQVGEELAESTPYFREALNEILAMGEEVF